MKPPVVLRSFGRVLVAVTAALGAASCASDFVTSSRSPSVLILDSLTAARVNDQGTPGTFDTRLDSDVLTNNTAFADIGQARLRVILKNPGTSTSPTVASPLNAITLTRYHVNYRRADGQNTPGRDIPHPFDGGLSATITSQSSTVNFDIVRVAAKVEPPLVNLVGGGGQVVISAIAEVTIYGRDQAGNDVSVTGSITITFADFGG
jgi:hypothetical protein